MNTLPALADAAALPTASRYRAELAPVETRWSDENGREYVGVAEIRIDGYTRLIPETDCRAILAEIEAAMAPAGRETASRLAKWLVGSYPAREVVDPDTYARAIASVFETVPADIGRAAVDEITRRLRFLPTRADVHEVTAAMVAERAHARRVAEAHLAEHARRQAAAEEVARKEAEEAEFEARHGEAWAAWLELPVLDRPPWEQFKDAHDGQAG